MPNDPTPNPSTPDEPRAPIPVLTFDYKRSPQYRTIHLNGAYGGRTLRGEVFAMLYSERPAHPTESSYKLEGGKITEEIGELRQGSGNQIRELEVCAMMSPAAAETLGRWLIKQAESAKGNPPFEAKVSLKEVSDGR